MSFSNDLAKFIEKTKANADQTVRAVTLEAGNSVIEMSPVDTGRFRGNWQHQSGTPATAPLDAVDKEGGATKARIAASVGGVQAGGVEFLTNNLPYARALEYGHSKQAPAGMVRVTAARLRSILAAVVKGME